MSGRKEGMAILGPYISMRNNEGRMKFFAVVRK